MRASSSLLLAAALASTFGCVRQAPPPVYFPANVALAQEGVVAVATQHLDGSFTLCSGTLVAPNLVLTARHCVSRALTARPACDVHGASHNGEHLAEDDDPSAITILVGDRVDPNVDEPRARATKTVRPTTQVLCDADLAFLVLDRDILGVEIVPMRLGAPVGAGDVVVPVGFGGGAAGVVGTRAARSPSPVLVVGPGHNGSTGAVLGPHEFEVDGATCKGDSGGPAIDAKTGEIVGVVSRGASCFGEGNHVYTRVDAYARLARDAFAAARTESAVRVARRSTPNNE